MVWYVCLNCIDSQNIFSMRPFFEHLVMPQTPSRITSRISFIDIKYLTISKPYGWLSYRVCKRLTPWVGESLV